jgi:hypothetical protein
VSINAEVILSDTKLDEVGYGDISTFEAAKKRNLKQAAVAADRGARFAYC